MKTTDKRKSSKTSRRSKKKPLDPFKWIGNLTESISRSVEPEHIMVFHDCAALTPDKYAKLRAGLRTYGPDTAFLLIEIHPAVR